MPDREKMERMRAAMDAALLAPRKLIIVEGENGLIMTDQDGASVRVPLNGKKDTGAANGVAFETSARGENGKLRVERKFKDGPTLVESYSVSADPHRLTVTSNVEGGPGCGRNGTNTRVYELREPDLIAPR